MHDDVVVFHDVEQFVGFRVNDLVLGVAGEEHFLTEQKMIVRFNDGARVAFLDEALGQMQTPFGFLGECGGSQEQPSDRWFPRGFDLLWLFH